MDGIEGVEGPWLQSSAGLGLCFTTFTASLASWAERILAWGTMTPREHRRQGYIVRETKKGS
jgi:hypothetical protein